MAYYSDIDPNIEKCLFDLMRQVPIDKILMMVAKLNQVVIELALHSFHMQYPYKIKARLHWRLADRILEFELAESAFGPLEEETDTDRYFTSNPACSGCAGKIWGDRLDKESIHQAFPDQIDLPSNRSTARVQLYGYVVH